MIDSIRKAVVISPHPDDETLGLGGSIKRLSSLGIEINILIISGHLPPLYKKSEFEITKNEAMKAFNELGVSNFKFLEIPATYVHTQEISVLYKKVSDFISFYSPELVFLPFPDRHIDHRVIFDASIVACRPVKENFPKIVLMYETLSETHWNVGGAEQTFNPDFYIDISNQIKNKSVALKYYQSQIKNNSSRSIEAVTALAKFRGSQNGCDFAEAFKTVRIVV